ncbi:glycosyltransferase family 4 protein [Parazoarcus communis]|uniref:Glycosyltransferase subfamily 4-like N-terminal domain-containing protein n=1 Tax=Parazoarcus communis SWub3 = DSM 12120 TaxID=1121029 RepID=A0A323V4J5_9RHOO|nr:glycosyltransferase family 4 protein [Parazoarcus communis]NMG72715.1 glycosyltransferase [Parazoarcus communis SWub3 = DSM 12120]PZA15088.1 hypothetical protein DNK49_18140 [Azoarcus communis] [Parazoarcus communis SWub3 = DSM 12120]
MKTHLLCKRFYTNKDLLRDRFGRLFHLPVRLAGVGNPTAVTAIDYRNARRDEVIECGVRFRTAPATPLKLPTLLPRLHGLLVEDCPDVLIASGDSHIGFLGLRLARRLRMHFVFDVYDYYPAFAGNRIPGMKAMFRYAVRNADLVLCASSVLRDRLAEVNPRCVLIENGFDPVLFSSGEARQAREALGLALDEQIVGYFGSLTPSRGPLLIEACRRLREGYPRLRLLLAGPVLDLAFSEPWITYLGVQPQEAIPNMIRACDVVTLPYTDDPFNAMAGACKIAEYLACGRPVVATRVSGHVEIFQDAPDGLCLPNVDDMIRALRAQLDAPKVLPFPRNMTWDAIAAKLHAELVQLGVATQ